MTTRKILITSLIIAVLLFAPFLIMSSCKPMVYDCQKTIDSLYSEIMTLQIDKGRYEIILDRVNEIDSNVYNQAIKNIE